MKTAQGFNTLKKISLDMFVLIVRIILRFLVLNFSQLAVQIIKNLHCLIMAQTLRLINRIIVMFTRIIFRLYLRVVALTHLIKATLLRLMSLIIMKMVLVRLHFIMVRLRLVMLSSFNPLTLIMTIVIPIRMLVVLRLILF